MANIYVKSGSGTPGSGTYRGVWSASQTWAVGDRVVGTNVVSYRVMECTTGGAGGAGAEPTWNTTTGGTTNDGAAVWTTRIPSTWANATTTLVRAAANDAAGDTIYVSHNHAESTASALTISLAGTTASPVKVLCVDDTAEPPTTLATSATVTTTGNSNLTIQGTSFYVYGISFTAASGGSSTASLYLTGNGGNDLGVFESCNFYLATSASTFCRIYYMARKTRLINCGLKFGASGQALRDDWGGATIELVGGSLLSGGTSPTALFDMAVASVVEVSGLDLTNASSSINLVSGGGSRVRGHSFRNVRLPTSWSGSLNSGTPSTGTVSEMFNCDGADTNYRYRMAASFGTIQDETTLVRTGGASDGATTISYKLVTNADAEFPKQTLDSPELVQWNDTTGSAITATVEILHDSATALTDKEVWLEVMYLGTSGVPLGSFATDTVDVLATASNQASSSATWTTTGMANPNKQALSVTFTPQEKGFIHATVKLAKASKTVYVDPKLTVS